MKKLAITIALIIFVFWST